MHLSINSPSVEELRLTSSATRAEQFSLWALRLWWCAFPELEVGWREFLHGFGCLRRSIRRGVVSPLLRHPAEHCRMRIRSGLHQLSAHPANRRAVAVGTRGRSNRRDLGCGGITSNLRARGGRSFGSPTRGPLRADSRERGTQLAGSAHVAHDSSRARRGGIVSGPPSLAQWAGGPFSVFVYWLFRRDDALPARLSLSSACICGNGSGVPDGSAFRDASAALMR